MKKPRYPLIKLKRRLQDKLNLEDEHHFAGFIQYSFWKSYRRESMQFQKRIKAQVDNETEIMKAEFHAGLPVDVPLHKIEGHVLK